MVSFPTFDADDHVKHFKDAPEGIKVLGADGKVSYQRGGDVLMVAAAWFMTWYESDESRGPGSGSGEVEFAAEEA